MRQEVDFLVALGPFPDSGNTTDEDVIHRESLLNAISIPVSDDEAISLVGLFGPDDYFGLAFSLRRLVESANGWPIWQALVGDDPWICDMRDRALNSGFVPPGRN